MQNYLEIINFTIFIYTFHFWNIFSQILKDRCGDRQLSLQAQANHFTSTCISFYHSRLLNSPVKKNLGCVQLPSKFAIKFLKFNVSETACIRSYSLLRRITLVKHQADESVWFYSHKQQRHSRMLDLRQDSANLVAITTQEFHFG